jgi:hypothetical protein
MGTREDDQAAPLSRWSLARLTSVPRPASLAIPFTR